MLDSNKPVITVITPCYESLNTKRRTYMMPVNNYMAQSPQPVIANDSIKQKEEMTQDCSITLLLSPTKTTVFQRATTSLGLILHRVQEQKNYPVKSTDHTLIIHGPHREHGVFRGYRLQVMGQWLVISVQRFWLKIILKILVKIYLQVIFVTTRHSESVLSLYSRCSKNSSL